MFQYLGQHETSPPYSFEYNSASEISTVITAIQSILTFHLEYILERNHIDMNNVGMFQYEWQHESSPTYSFEFNSVSEISIVIPAIQMYFKTIFSC